VKQTYLGLKFIKQNSSSSYVHGIGVHVTSRLCSRSYSMKKIINWDSKTCLLRLLDQETGEISVDEGNFKSPVFLQAAKPIMWFFLPWGRAICMKIAATTKCGCTNDLDFSLTSTRLMLRSPEQNWECTLLVSSKMLFWKQLCAFIYISKNVYKTTLNERYKK